jgi:ABC-2 type transport system permease protein
MVRDPGTLFFALLIPLIQLFLFGYAVDTNVRQISTAVLDESQTQESRRSGGRAGGVGCLSHGSYATVQSDDAMYEAIRSGKARVGVKIPYDYARRLQDGTTATVLVLVDGSDSNVAGQAVNAATGVALEESLSGCCRMGRWRSRCGRRCCSTRATRSANFFVPGLIAVLLQVMIILLIALSLVRERERGTLEQLTMTPVAPLGLMVGKMIPYGVLGLASCA